MYGMNLLLRMSILISFLVFTQEKKEIVYLIFDIASNEKCEVDIEGKGVTEVNKYRVCSRKNVHRYFICDEKFDLLEGHVDTLNVDNIDEFNVVDIQYVVDRKNEGPLRFNPFEKIFLIEVIDDHQMLILEVGWIDEWEEIE